MNMKGLYSPAGKSGTVKLKEVELRTVPVATISVVNLISAEPEEPKLVPVRVMLSSVLMDTLSTPSGKASIKGLTLTSK